ncbi:hypothetical protein BDZ89DRAFT_1062880 [Hymenopellis radicata]|nr:hypothetical protein BDZ89DRAFT_1062880 [Hymenopellis radicata]
MSQPPVKTQRGQSNSPILGIGDIIGEGDTHLVEHLLDDELAGVAFERLKNEVEWATMYHRGGEVPRRVAVQGVVEPDGSIPLYRHPADESPPLRPFTPTVAAIAARASATLNHPVNHVLIQHYRSGADYISEHSDKTIDVVRDSSIVNVSLGAQRTMFLRTKRDAGPKKVQRVPLPHNSMFVLGLNSNRVWGDRISLTFRWIGTYLTPDLQRIWGQGATGKTPEDAKLVLNGEEQAAHLIEAFGRENRDSSFNWDEAYGEGFDVLHFNVH